MSKIDENHSSLHFPLQLSLVKMEMVSQSEYEGFLYFVTLWKEGKKRRKEWWEGGWVSIYRLFIFVGELGGGGRAVL